MGRKQNLHEKGKKTCCCQYTLRPDINDTITGTRWKCTKWCVPPCPDAMMVADPPKGKDITFSDDGNTAIVNTAKSKTKKSPIKFTETELTNLIGKIVMEQTYSVVDDPMKGIDDTFSHQQTKQANDAKDSINNVNITQAADVEHSPDAMFEEDEMPEEWMDELEDETGVQRPAGYPQDLPDVEYSSMPSPTTAPTPTKTPTITPTRPKRQDPFKVPRIKPGEEPAPKAGMEREREMVTMGESQLISMIERLVMEATKGKCPESGCIKKVGKSWRVISNKTGKLWPAHYDTEKDAQDGLEAYHAGK
jgi:hypothetical protein